ncbi:proline and serine-rich protein 3 isoform X2 [Parambassis ranga]|uniref:Proline and serine-rich protein 3 isoform X2 n=1 Tax=Parambassis ranga TaxID=210632 RepID=A0A6P7JWI3_9TELE|nr:proline and serine-rich protein 3 isoform X2 [Parambassis ranga]
MPNKLGSRSVFTNKNPFQPVSTVKKSPATCNQAVSKKQRTKTLSPVRPNRRSGSQLHQGSKQLNKKRDHCFPNNDGQPVVEETWPSSDNESSPGNNTASSEVDVLTQHTAGSQQDSVLAKYVERFRCGQPQSREERRQMASVIGDEQEPFWWMSHSSLHSSTPTKPTEKNIIPPLKGDHDIATYSPAGQRQCDRSLSPCRGSLSGEFDDTEILHLQERANRLLLQRECNSDGSIPVSSEGLGCSDFSSPVSVEELAKRPLIPSLINPSTQKASLGSVHAAPSQNPVIWSLVPPTRPEDDILFQWRLRRKMEQAREWPQSLHQSNVHGSTFSWQLPSTSHSSIGGQAYKEQDGAEPSRLSQRFTRPHIVTPQPEARAAHRSCPPAPGPPLPPHHACALSDPSVSQPQTIAHVPAHMHLLCDVLPCPIQSSHAKEQHMSDESHTTFVQKKTKIPESSTNTLNDVPLDEQLSPHSPDSSGSIQGEWSRHQKVYERNKKNKVETKESERTAGSMRQHKKSARSSSHQRLPNKVISLKEQHRREESRDFSSESCTADLQPPPSPVHSALGQVVSEVLFPAVDSAPKQEIPVSSVLSPSTISAPVQSPVPCSAQSSIEVISQLLQEAEDSDEKEFEDDPLLQVLRKQRRWVKEQISEVDSMLKDFQGNQQIT